MTSIKMVGYIYDFKDRHPDVSKITKILKWPPPSDIIIVRVFISVYIYFRI